MSCLLLKHRSNTQSGNSGGHLGLVLLLTLCTVLALALLDGVLDDVAQRGSAQVWLGQLLAAGFACCLAALSLTSAFALACLQTACERGFIVTSALRNQRALGCK